MIRAAEREGEGSPLPIISNDGRSFVNAQMFVPIIGGDVGEEHVRRRVLIFFRQIPECFDGLIKKSGHTRILYHSEIDN
jgi:hypothetical protein